MQPTPIGGETMSDFSGKMSECGWCDGTGEVIDFPEPSLPYGHHVACPFCGGTGSAPQNGAFGESHAGAGGATKAVGGK